MKEITGIPADICSRDNKLKLKREILDDNRRATICMKCARWPGYENLMKAKMKQESK